MTLRMSLRDRLIRSANSHARRSAVWIKGERISYEQLFSEAEELAKQLDNTVPSGVSIGIYCQRDLTSLRGILAAALSNRPYVPLNPTFPMARLKSILRQSGLGAVICSTETQANALDLLEDSLSELVLIDAECKIFARRHANGIYLPSAGNPDSAAYIMFTSGTTGVPKGVRVLDSNLTAYLDGIKTIADLTPEDRSTHFFDLSFDLSVHDLFVTWCAGAELMILPKEENMAIGQFINEQHVTSWFSVPSLASFCERIGQLKVNGMPSLRLALFCGEPLALTVARSFASAAPSARVWNLYGPTEATIALTAFELKRPDGLGDELPVVPLGFPIGSQQIRVDMIDGTSGEFLLGGSQVTPGYINAPELNETKFFTEGDGTRYYRTGDLVHLSDDHGAIFLGRIDDQVKINGYRVELLEIDATLREAAGTAEVASIPWPPAREGNPDHIVAFVTEPKYTPAEIRKTCRIKLPGYMVPRKIFVIEKMPVTSSGKIDRAALAKLVN